MPPTPSAHRLRQGLPGYLILFAPPAFGPQRQYRSRDAPSPPVFFLISAHFTATPGIPVSSPGLKPDSLERRSPVEPENFTPHLTGAYAPFTPSKSEQRLLPPYYRGCWHGVSRSFLCRYRQTTWVLTRPHFFPADRSLQPESLHPPRGVARSGFPPLPKPLDCCLP